MKIPLKYFEKRFSNFKIQSAYLETGATQIKKTYLDGEYVNIFVMCDINVLFMNRYAAEKSQFRHRRKHPFASMKKWQGTFLILNN